MHQFYPFSMISMELKATFRRATRGHDENAVARQITRVLEEHLFLLRTKIRVFAPKFMSSHQNPCFRTKTQTQNRVKKQTQIRPTSPHPPPKKIIALFTDFDDLGHFHNDFSQRFRHVSPNRPISPKIKQLARKVAKSCFLATSTF